MSILFMLLVSCTLDLMLPPARLPAWPRYREQLAGAGQKTREQDKAIHGHKQGQR
jgi:hypothetical protein